MSATTVMVEAGGLRWSLPLHVVERVVRLPAWRPASRAAPCVLGIVDVHGEDVVMLDLAHLHGAPAGDWDDGDLVLCRIDGRRVALAVDRAHGVRAGDARRAANVELDVVRAALDG